MNTFVNNCILYFIKIKAELLAWCSGFRNLVRIQNFDTDNRLKEEFAHTNG